MEILVKVVHRGEGKRALLVDTRIKIDNLQCIGEEMLMMHKVKLRIRWAHLTHLFNTTVTLDDHVRIDGK